MKHLRHACVVPLVVLCAAAGPVQAQTSTPGAPDPADAARPVASDEDRDDGEPVGFRWKDGLRLRLGGAGHIDFKLRLQFDARSSDGVIGDTETDASVDLARRRVGVEGELFGMVAFEVERELAGDEPWRDVFVNVRPVAALQVQAGHFRLPFGMDENLGATNLDFVYRSLAARNLSPGRDPGGMLHGRVLPRRVLRYELGVFRQDGRNARTRNERRVTGDTTLAGRVALQPWRNRRHVLQDLHVGVGITRSDVPFGLPAMRGESVLGFVFDRPDTPVLGLRRRTGVELRWRPGPFSLRSEYMRVTTAREGQSVTNEDLPPLLGRAWYVSGTWVVTGERKADGLTQPRRPVHRKGWGAIEVAARVERLAFGSDGGEGAPSTSPRAEVVMPASERVLTLGVNWYLNRFVKVQVNGVRETFEDAARSPRPGHRVVFSLLLRLQLTL